MKDFNGLSLGFKGSKRILTKPKDVNDLLEASKHLKDVVIPDFVRKLDDL
jgi:hypothetical protein